jgi:branched-chain amino acid transport system substrate-binding protein
VLLSVLLLSGCALPRSTAPVLKIGLIAPFEGLGRPLGYEVLHGVKLAVWEWNEGGGVSGYKIALVALNDDDDPVRAARQALKMDVDADVVGVIGPVSRATARAVAPPLADAGLAWLAVTSAPDDVIAAHDNGFRLYASDAVLAESVIREAISLGQSGAVEQVAVRTSGEFGEPLRAAAEQRGVYHPLETMAVRPSFPVALGGTAEEVADELLSLGGCQGLVVAGPESGRAVVAQRAGEAAEGLVWVGSLRPADAGDLPQGFVEGYERLAGGPPGPYAMLAYDATSFLLSAIERDIDLNGRPTRQGVVKALPGLQVRGLGGELSVDDQGGWRAAPVYRYQVVEGDIFAQPRLLIAGL